jgi:hypothetical protein
MTQHSMTTKGEKIYTATFGFGKRERRSETDQKARQLRSLAKNQRIRTIQHAQRAK